MERPLVMREWHAKGDERAICGQESENAFACHSEWRDCYQSIITILGSCACSQCGEPVYVRNMKEKLVLLTSKAMSAMAPRVLFHSFQTTLSY